MATEPEAILFALHDRWFDVDAITFDTETRSVTIPFWGKPTRRFPRDAEGRPKPFDHEMRIRGVSNYRVDDRERVGIYSFNKVEPGDKTLTITADPHMTITLEGEGNDDPRERFRRD
ncbi:MAG: hypothetical protein M3R48_02765 [Candidatus Dormibacteraeota bacterium]|nr:hypothetical protein [Candidatus Dormibacteraeota bacterium]